MRRYDNIILGIILGLIAPIVGMFGYYIFTYRSQTSFRGFIEYFNSIHIIVASLSLACYAMNLPLFFLFIWKENYKSSRGVLFATIAYTLWVVYEKTLG
ncbi:MAG: hypothetical protein HY064_14685 [Bacteroidetes bacterium]|nr:hypothetical protein [Bacteroidota bacterium]